MISFYILSFGFFILIIIDYLHIIYGYVKTVKVKNDSSILNNKNTKIIKSINFLSLNNNNTNNNKNNNEIINKEVYIKLKQAPGPLPLPLLGNLPLLGKYEVPFEGFTKLSKIYGDIYSLTLGNTRCVVVNNLELIREVLNQNGKFFGGRPDFLRYNKLFGGDRNNSLALCDWSQLQQKRRNMARRHCSPRHTSSYFSKMDDVGRVEIQNFMEILNLQIQSNSVNEDNTIHLKPLILQACANMFSQYMCSIRFNYNDKEFQEIVRKFDEIFWEINQGYAVDFLPWLYPFYKNHIHKLSLCAITVRKFILERVINEREQQNIDIDEPDKDFTDALLKSLNEDPSLSKNTLIFMLEDFLGGHSAVGNLVMLVLAYIIKNPHICKNIQNEIDNVIKHNAKTDNNLISLNDINKMPYTQATIFETLRSSSSPIVPHVATENVCISGYGISKGTVVFINNYELNTSEKYWDMPKMFKPERFLEKFINSNDNDDKNNGANVSIENQNQNSNDGIEYRIKQNIPHFFPFSVGKRTCIGQNLVKCFSFIIIANILRIYDISYTNSEPMKIYPACVALPPDTFALKLKMRNI